jgi:hypothetical protein
MKRTYDNAMQSAPSTAGQISAGMAATKENIYMNTNMVTIQREDHTSLHGVQSNFNQTRVLPIVGKTSRAEIALKSADVQTKALPMFQPQVALGPDINRLIYETGLSASWRNSMLMLPPDETNLSTLLYEGALLYPGGGSTSVWRGGDEKASYYGESTFTNDSTALLPVIDTYNIKYQLTLLPDLYQQPPIVNTQLSILLEYWKTRTFGGFATSDLRKTCLTPVVVASESEPIISVKVGTAAEGEFENKYIVSVQDTSGFKVGDRVRFFGTSLTDTPYIPMDEVFSTVIDIVTVQQQTASTSTHLPAIILDGVDQTPLPVPSVPVINSYYFVYQPYVIPNPTITFTTSGQLIDPAYVVGALINVQSNQPLINGIYPIVAVSGNPVQDIIINAPDGLDPSLLGAPSTLSLVELPPAPPSLQDGYIINQRVVNGGHIEFLTDMYEFAPLTLNGFKQSMEDRPGLLKVTYDGPTPLLDQGFWRGFKIVSGNGTEIHPMTSTVELIINDIEGANPTIYTLYAKIFNGFYSISERSYDNVTELYYFTLAPISKALPFSLPFDLSDPLVSFTMKLAPNFYTFDTKADEIIDPDLTPKKLSFMRSLGYIPTDDIPIQKPTYPPTASVPVNTWTRAFQVNWDFSAYRNIQWVSQDTISPKPKPPLVSQDFGFDNGSSTYYNVYEFNKFLNDCVNPSVERCINDVTYEVPMLDALSLNFQLALAFNAYKGLLTDDITSYVWQSTVTYELGDLVVTSATNGARAFMCAVESTQTILPTSAASNKYWYFLGFAPSYVDSAPFPRYELCVRSSVLNGFRIMSAKIEDGDPLPAEFFQDIAIAYVPLSPNSPFTIPDLSQIISTPEFKTVAPLFHYNELTLLSSVKYDGYSFGTTNVNQTGLSSKQIAIYNYNRTSWGFQGYEHADEWMTFESNTSFKFLLDNFPSYCTQYEDTLAELRSGGTQYPAISYWVWDNTSSVDPRREPTPLYEIYQTSESMSSCMSPVQSIVVVSDNIPVLEELASPVNYLIDSESSSFTNSSATIGLTQKIIGEFTLPSFAPYNSRSIVKYDTEELKFYSLLDTKLFKQLEYSLYYRHRIAQQLVPLIISNYGSVNIKFVFRPIS